MANLVALDMLMLLAAVLEGELSELLCLNDHTATTSQLEAHDLSSTITLSQVKAE
jgi:hypothetical protein